ncbi:low molecular weight phosphatase family protein [Nesterenkonia muleiensis]|uniref:arsenate-mycothiol transferase ArsC n=1 Tax=Nesterenkonia muleiensis TaxID=2282648 RepID=UPI000E759ED9|nr:low molecular weight phosphatase family protein [Nesterenkonia muleiensis]
MTGVLFVCVKNRGKSQMAAGLFERELAEAGRPDAVRVSSAGTQAGTTINALSAEVLAELGVNISGRRPTQLTEEAMRDAGLVVVLGAEAQVPDVYGVTVERWETDEPSLRGIDGRERMELVRDDIHARVRELAARIAG